MDRPDRSSKLKERKELSETVVKCCLKKLIRSNKEQVIQAIHGRVETYSKRVYLASLIINLILKESVDQLNNDELVDHILPSIIEHSFIRQAMLGTDDAVEPYEDLVSLFNLYPIIKTKIDSLGRHFSDRNIYSSGSKKYQTNLKNHLVLNLGKVMKKILYSDRYNSSLKNARLPIEDTIKAMLYTLNGWKGKYNHTLIDRLPEDIQESFNLQKKILGPDSIDKLWLKSEDNKYRILKYFIYANRFLEANNEKIFNLVPICSIRGHFITIDTHSLYGIAIDAGIIQKNINSQKFMDLGTEQWGSILDTDLVKGNGKIFTKTIDTDGISVCVHFHKRKVKISEHNDKTDNLWKNDPNIEVAGFDTGRTNIVLAVKVIDGRPISYRLTRSQYYQSSGISKASKNTLLWLKNIKDITKILSENSPKGVTLNKFLTFMDIIFSLWDSLWEEYLHPKWANQRLRLYGGKKRTLANFFNKLETPGKKTIIAYGSAKFAPGGKNEMSVPTTRIYKECKYRFPTYLTDEFRSTIVYNGDKTTILEGVKRKDTKKVVRGLLWCRSTNENKGKLINRDLNAALNIRDCFLLEERPPMLTRMEGGGKIEKKIGYFINC